MKIIFRILSVLAFFGSLYWISLDTSEIGPYLTALAFIITFLGTFLSSSKAIEPSINITLSEAPYLKYLLILENPTNEDAHDINVIFNLKENQKFPLQRKIYDETFPIRTMFSHSEKEIETLISPVLAINEKYDITWSWQNKKGKSFSRNSILQ